MTLFLLFASRCWTVFVEKTTWIPKTNGFNGGVNRFVYEMCSLFQIIFCCLLSLLQRTTDHIFYLYWIKKSSINHPKLKARTQARKNNLTFCGTHQNVRRTQCAMKRIINKTISSEHIPNNCIINSMFHVCRILLWLVILMNTRAIKICD